MPLTEIRNTESLWFRLHYIEFEVLGTSDWSCPGGSWHYGTQEANLGWINSKLKLDFTTSCPQQEAEVGSG